MKFHKKVIHQLTPAAPNPPSPSPRLLGCICPPFQSRGRGGAFATICAARGPGICQPFDTPAVSYQNITTPMQEPMGSWQRILLEKGDWLICQGQVVVKAWSIIHSPLFFRKIVEIEWYVLRAAILHECQNYLGDGNGLGESETAQEFPPMWICHPHARQTKC